MPNDAEEVPPGDNDKHVEDDVSDDEEEDPFLRVFGGESKLLTGDAYHKMFVGARATTMFK